MSRPPETATSLMRLPASDETGGRARRVDAATPRVFLPVRRVADLVRNGLIGLLEAHGRQKALHAERVRLVMLEKQPYFVEVVLGAVGGARAGYARVEEPFGVLS